MSLTAGELKFIEKHGAEVVTDPSECTRTFLCTFPQSGFVPVLADRELTTDNELSLNLLLVLSDLIAKAICRTEKFLCCIPRVPYILNSSWLKASVKAKEFLGSSRFLLAVLCDT